MDLALIGILILLGFGVPISILDARTKNIPNWIPLSFLVSTTLAVLISALFFGASFAGGFVSSLLALLVLPLYLMAKGGFGEADVKLAPGFGMLLGGVSLSAVTIWFLGTFYLGWPLCRCDATHKKTNQEGRHFFCTFYVLECSDYLASERMTSITAGPITTIKSPDKTKRISANSKVLAGLVDLMGRLTFYYVSNPELPCRNQPS